MMHNQPHSHAAQDEERNEGEQEPLKAYISSLSLDLREDICHTLGISILSVVRTISVGQVSQHSPGIRGHRDSGLSTSAGWLGCHCKLHRLAGLTIWAEALPYYIREVTT